MECPESLEDNIDVQPSETVESVNTNETETEDKSKLEVSNIIEENVEGSRTNIEINEAPEESQSIENRTIVEFSQISNDSAPGQSLEKVQSQNEDIVEIQNLETNVIEPSVENEDSKNIIGQNLTSSETDVEVNEVRADSPKLGGKTIEDLPGTSEAVQTENEDKIQTKDQEESVESTNEDTKEIEPEEIKEKTVVCETNAEVNEVGEESPPLKSETMEVEEHSESSETVKIEIKNETIIQDEQKVESSETIVGEKIETNESSVDSEKIVEVSKT